MDFAILTMQRYSKKIDVGVFDGTVEFCNTLALRSLSHEAYHYLQNRESRKRELEFFLKNKIFKKDSPIARNFSASNPISDLRHNKILDLMKGLLNPESLPYVDFGRHVVFELDIATPIQSCGAALARYSMTGRDHHEHYKSQPDYVRGWSVLMPTVQAISTCRSERGICIVYSLYPNPLDSSWIKTWLSDLDSIEEGNMLAYLFYHLVYTSGTTFFKPEWFKALSLSSQNTLLEISNAGVQGSGFGRFFTPTLFDSISQDNFISVNVIQNAQVK